MGHSTDVPLSVRVSTWIRIVPLLLEHLDIKHVALVSHSAGTIYLLNTLHYHRDILHPDQPFIALFGKLKRLYTLDVMGTHLFWILA